MRSVLSRVFICLYKPMCLLRVQNSGLDMQALLCSVLQCIQRRMRSGCHMNKRKKHPNAAQLLQCGSTNWALGP